MSLLTRNRDKTSDRGRNGSGADRRDASTANGKAPDKPTGLSLRSWGGVLGRTIREFNADNLTDWAAALTYYSILSLFPALIAFVGIVGLVGQNPQTTDAILKIIGDVGPSSAVDTFRGPVQTVMT